MTKTRSTLKAFLLGTSLTILASGAAGAQGQPQGTSLSGDALAREADQDMRRVLDSLQKLGPKPIETLSPEEARTQPTPTDAVMAVIRERGKDPAKLKAATGVTTQDMTYPIADGMTQKVRIYKPEPSSRTPNRALPVVVYFHGGGFVIGDLDVYDGGPRALADKADAIVVSVEYRHAPEHKFPAQHQDAFAAYEWVLKNAAQWGGDPARVAVAGESAGGNLAANVAIMARDRNIQKPVHMLLVYPVAGVDMTTPSYIRFANAKPLNKAMMEWFIKTTVKPEDMASPMLDLVGKADLRNLPGATVITAEIDPLMSEGRALADKLRQAGSSVRYHNYSGVTHEFFGMDAVVRDADRAQDYAARNLVDAFEDAVPASGSVQPRR